jgi:D-3-phosphoglycerate dehydrogenase / 2-oxoglutarate reductase
MALSRNLAPAYAGLIAGRWDRNLYMGTQLAGKTLGIIGLGRIGQAVAVRARALEMKIIGYDPFLSGARAKELGIETCGAAKELLPLVDYLTVHTPLTDETRGLVGREELKTMRKGVRLINCARGGIYDEAALVEGLKSGQVGGVALDVYESEPCTDSPLFSMPNVLCTPHLGASTEEAQTSVAVEGVGLLIDFLTKGEIRQAVNMSPLDEKTLQGLRGYLNLSYRLGLLLSQMDKSPPNVCKLSFEGEVASKDTRLLSAAFAAGLLENALETDVNLVNAEMLLRERGIELLEQRKSDVGDFTSLVKAEVVSDAKTSQAAGALFGKMKPKLVQKAGCDLEAGLEGTLLIFTHRDAPGVIGKVGTLCGRHGVNIAGMAVGREVDEPGGNAVGVLSLDSQPSAAAIAELLQIQDVKCAWVVNLPPAEKMPSWMGG